jgi:hypothetical protein
MRSASIEVTAPKLSRELRTKPAAMLEAFRNDPATFLADGQFAVTFKSPLEGYASRLREILAEAWQTYLGTKVPPINEGALATLEAAGLQKQVAQLRNVLVRMRDIQRQLPVDDAPIKTLATLAKEAKEAWNELGQVPAPVLAFLRKASRREAVLADLNEDVRKWLAEKDLLKHLRISLGQ